MDESITMMETSGPEQTCWPWGGLQHPVLPQEALKLLLRDGQNDDAEALFIHILLGNKKDTITLTTCREGFLK